MFFEDTRFIQSLKVTTIYVVVSVPLQLIFALALALALDRGLRGLSFYRSIYYLPSLLGGSVAIAILWRKIFGTDGLVNAVLGIFGIQGTGWVSDPDTALGTLILLHVWTFGAPMVIFLAGLRQIPQSYYEAAAVDGASKFRQFRSITMPLLTPIIFFNLVLEVIKSFQSFTQSFIVSNGTGGPVDSTLFYTLYLYLKGFKSYEMGYAAAMAWVLLLIIAGLTGVNFLASKYWVFYGDTKQSGAVPVPPAAAGRPPDQAPAADRLRAGHALSAAVDDLQLAEAGGPHLQGAGPVAEHGHAGQ